MTREEAIRRIKEHMIHHHIGEYPHIFIGEALEMAIDAMREQEEYEIQRHLKHFDIKAPRPATDTNVGHKWISVEERLPKTWKDVLTCRRNGHVEMNWLMLVDGWHKDDPELNPVTHWMPLPEPPEVEV